MFGLFKKKPTTPLRKLTYIGSKATPSEGTVYGVFVKDVKTSEYTQMTMCMEGDWKLTVVDGGIIKWHRDKQAVIRALDDWIIFNETGKMPDRSLEGITLTKHPDDEEDYLW